MMDHPSTTRQTHDAAENGEVVLRLEGITKTYVTGEVETRVLKGIDLDLRRGELSVVLGASGSGKSTLLNIAGGMDRPTEGRVMYGQTNLAALDDAALTSFRRERLGFVFQFYNLVPTLTALENVRVATEIASDPMDPAEALSWVDLSERVDHFPSQLSGGEQQRVAIARAIAKRPEILFCDEPTGALDFRIGKSVLGILKRLNEKFGTTTVIITHNVAISKIARRVIYLSGGVIDRMEENAQPTPVEEITW